MGSSRSRRRKVNKALDRRRQAYGMLLSMQRCGFRVRLKLALKILFRADARAVEKMKKQQGGTKR